ncbi:MAG: hypothetical protein ACFFDY_01345 [Candidatus Thorarchaeota archaeon]
MPRRQLLLRLKLLQLHKRQNLQFQQNQQLVLLHLAPHLKLQVNQLFQANLLQVQQNQQFQLLVVHQLKL